MQPALEAALKIFKKQKQISDELLKTMEETEKEADKLLEGLFKRLENDYVGFRGHLINVFETPKGVTKDGKEYGGESKIQVMYENTLANGEKRTDMETLTVADTSPPQQEKLACARSCGFKRVSGKGVFKGNDLSAFWGGCRADEAHPKWREKAPFFGAHNLIHGLKALIPCWAWVSEGVAVLKNRENMNE